MIEILSIILSVLLLFVAVGDCRDRRIPNSLVGIIALVGLLRAVVSGDAATPEHWLALLVLFAAAIALFAVGAFGGGDAKLIPSLALALPLAQWPVFLLTMAMSGGLLALAMLVRRRWSVLGRKAQPPTAVSLPYGVAIAIGGWAALWQAGPVLAAVSPSSPWVG